MTATLTYKADGHSPRVHEFIGGGQEQLDGIPDEGVTVEFRAEGGDVEITGGANHVHLLRIPDGHAERRDIVEWPVYARLIGSGREAAA